tara:strand:+ start:13042 stop:13383 length:342 start_codon:yes stop_codon:yes gene_type:complete
MKKKLVITESQLKMLTNILLEDTDYSVIVKTIEEDLNKNYRRAVEVYRDGNEYKKRKVFEIIFDGNLISGEDLLKYFKLKYNHGSEFIKQVINDWDKDLINNGMLSKNIGLRE